jgi:hypothetical protein
MGAPRREASAQPVNDAGAANAAKLATVIRAVCITVRAPYLAAIVRA